MPNYPVHMNTLLKALEDMQALDIKIIDVHEHTSVTDFMIICSGRASRHVKAIAETAMEKLKADGLPCLSVHGLENAEWVLVDFGDFVLHAMQAESRAFYNLEGLWQEPQG